jgi:hypothetical protein
VIAADERVHQTLARQWAPMAGISEARLSEWNQLSQTIVADAMQAMRERHSPSDEKSQALLDAWIEGFASLHSRKPDAEFVGWVVGYFDSAYDLRITRYWELVSRIKGMPYDPTYAQAFEWLLNGLRARIIL